MPRRDCHRRGEEMRDVDYLKAMRETIYLANNICIEATEKGEIGPEVDASMVNVLLAARTFAQASIAESLATIAARLEPVASAAEMQQAAMILSPIPPEAYQ